MNSVRNVLGFFTILPLSRAGTLKDVARAGWLVAIAGVLIGGAEGLIGLGSLRLLGQPVTAALILAVSLLLMGLHHADGLADLGDAIMVHGDASRRIEVLKDRTLGIGAVGAVLLTYLITWSALTQLLALNGEDWKLPALLIAVEVAARLSLQIVAFVSKPSHEGAGMVFLEMMKGWRGIAGFILSLAILAAVSLVSSAPGVLAALAAAIVTGLALAALGKKLFGGAGGDLLGASVELGRLAAVLALVGVLLRVAPL